MNLNIFVPIRHFGNWCHTSENIHIKMVLSNSFEIKCLVLPSLEQYKFSHYQNQCNCSLSALGLKGEMIMVTALSFPRDRVAANKSGCKGCSGVFQKPKGWRMSPAKRNLMYSQYLYHHILPSQAEQMSFQGGQRNPMGRTALWRCLLLSADQQETGAFSKITEIEKN